MVCFSEIKVEKFEVGQATLSQVYCCCSICHILSWAYTFANPAYTCSYDSHSTEGIPKLAGSFL